MSLAHIRGRSVVNWTGFFLTFLLLVLIYTLWFNENVVEDETKEPQYMNFTPVKTNPPPVRKDPSFKCYNKYPLTRRELRGKFWVLYNYVRPMNKNFSCDESITYTTHGDYTFNDNLLPLLTRWEGPISMAIYAPGWDFYNSLKSIFYYRSCVNSSLVKDYLTFHLYFDIEHLPFLSTANHSKEGESQLRRYIQDFEKETASFDCDSIRKEVILQSNQTLYKNVKNLEYPVNVGRNIARLESTTHYIFPSDVELYPSPGLIPAFLSMIKKNKDPALHRPNPRVFVNSIFEVKKDIKKMPETKKELLKALDSGDAIPFHKKVCSLCHSIPKSKEWTKNSNVQDDEMRIFHTAKRMSPFQHWEPIYIGTNEEPLYDERLSWEGRSDKMTQGYQLCLKDYDFHILNNAFLIHRPGIKAVSKISKKKSLQVNRQNNFIKTNISKEFDVLYGHREGCRLF